MEAFPTYGKTPHLDFQQELYGQEVIITEKIHGTNIRLMADEHGIWVGSRNYIIYNPIEDKYYKEYDGHGFYAWYLAKKEEFDCLKFFDCVTFYGEFYGAGVQKGVQYFQTARKGFSLFAAKNFDGSWFSINELRRAIVTRYFNLPPILYQGVLKDREHALSFIDQNSVVGKQNGVVQTPNVAEGIVIQAVDYDKRLIAKLKSEKWAEFASHAQPRTPKEVDAETAAKQERAHQFAEYVCTKGRLAVVIEHIQREKLGLIDVRRTGEILKEFIATVADDELPEYEALNRSEKSLYNKAINQKVIPLWKTYLRENQ